MHYSWPKLQCEIQSIHLKMKESLVTNTNNLGVLCVFHKLARHVYIEQQFKLHAHSEIWCFGV